jgi:hypothetical protein
MDDIKSNFLKLVNPQKTQIIGKLPFIWVFGSGGEDVKKIETIANPLNPGHQDFEAYKNINSYRAKFIQWSRNNQHSLSELLTVPEMYPEWLNFNKYSNLVDFELDITSISKGTIVFSESVGAYTEIGMFSCFSELHKNILIVVPSEYIADSNSSFFNYGAILKIKENRISEDLTNIFALDSISESNKDKLDSLFKNIADHFSNIINNKDNSSLSFNHSNKHHVILLFLDLIDLFPSKPKSFYKNILEEFGVDINKINLDKMITTLELLDLISKRLSGNNTYYDIKVRNYSSCIKYIADRPNRFERSDFKLNMR